MEGLGARYRRRGHLADRVLRSRHGIALLADRQSLPGHRRRSAGRRQSVYQLRGGARSQDRETALVFSIHPSRSARLGCHGTARAGQCRLSRAERKLLLQANRSGFFYVLDRTTGELLSGKPFVRKLTWASGIGRDGRPQELEGSKPTPAGTKTCPAVRGATNWYSTAYNPATRLFYVMAVEDCNHIPPVGARRICAVSGPVESAGEISSGHRYRDRQDRLGSSAGGSTGRQITPVFCRRPADWSSTGRRGGSFAAVDAKIGRDAVALRYRPGMEGFPHDLHGEWTAVRGYRIRRQHTFLCFGG